jgi:hypothetical protein
MDPEEKRRERERKGMQEELSQGGEKKQRSGRKLERGAQ